MAYLKVKTEMGSCTPRSQSSRWMTRAEAKANSKRGRRQNDKHAVREGLRDG